MANKKEEKKEAKKADFVKIKNCKTCNGKPSNQSAFTAEPFQGIKCDDCFEVISFERINSK